MKDQKRYQRAKASLRRARRSREQMQVAIARGRKPMLELMNLRVTRKDRKQLAAKARKYANGNVSEWLRRAGREFQPKRSAR